jgi:hypothetical protein
MTLEGDPAVTALARSAGFVMTADDGRVGEIETPLFPGDDVEPDYLVVRTRLRGRLMPRFPVVPVCLVTRCDVTRRSVRVRGPAATIRSLPETLPLAI